MKIPFSLAAVLALSACGGAGSSVSPSSVAAFRSSALSASTAVTTYQGAAQTMTTPADCQAAAQQYATQMGAALQTMRQDAPGMDEHMRSMGEGGAADMACGVDVMTQELQQHLGVACASSDMAQNRTVAVQHCQAMAADADHLQMRGAGMGAMMGDGGMMGGSGMMGAMGPIMDGGYTAPDGEHMTWGEPMHGCTLSGGTYQVTSGADAGAPSTPPAG